MEEGISWVPVTRNYEQERQRAAAPRQAAETSHPLLPQRIRESPAKSQPASSASSSEPSAAQTKPVVKAIEELDPLSAMLLSGGSKEPAFVDPLANPPPESHRGGSLSVSGSDTAAGRRGREEAAAEEVQPSWSSRKQAILSAFAISGNVRMQARLLRSQPSSEQAEGASSSRVVVSSSSGGLDRYQQRLGQLEAGLEDSGGPGAATREMTQKEYLSHVDKLHEELRRAWTNEERVQSLKLSIQCAKLLGDTSQPRYYPSMFVHVTDVLDDFGRMVFDRLRAKAAERGPGSSSSVGVLGEEFSASEVSEAAKETCRNWFYKTACIRELLPRLYIECAFVRCYRFLADGQAAAVLTRLAGITRGVGDPLVAAYARAYLARQAVSLRVPDAQLRPLMMALLVDQLAHLQDFRSRPAHYHGTYLAKRAGGGGALSDAEYVHLQSPAIDWILRVLARPPCEREVFSTVLGHYRDLSNHPSVLGAILEAFEPRLYSSSSNAMVALISMAATTTEDTSMQQQQQQAKQTLWVLRSLGSRLQLCPPPEDQRRALLNDVWRLVAKASEEQGDSGGGVLDEYCACVWAWVGLAAKAYGEREVGLMLADLGRHIDRALARHQEQQTAGAGGRLQLSEWGQTAVEGVLSTVLVELGGGSGGSLVVSEHLMKVMDLLPATRRLALAKDLLEALAKKGRPIADPLLIHALLDIARTLHDSLDSLSPEGEVRHASRLICGGLVGLVDLGPHDLERALALYVDCRAALPNLDGVLAMLVQCVARLAMRAHSMARARLGHSNRKTAALVKACLAYCHITIPSLSDPLQRLQLMVLCGQVSLVCGGCLPQTDTFLKAAISLVPDVPSHEEVDYRRTPTEGRLASLLQSLCGLLVQVPGHPEHGPFYLLTGLITALRRFAPWQQRPSALCVQVHISALAVLAAQAQRRLPLRLPGVEGNDELYGGAPDYMSELLAKAAALLATTLALIEGLTGTDQGQPATPSSSRPLGLSGSGTAPGGGSSAARQQAELSLQLLNQLLALAQLQGEALMASLARLVELSEPMRGSAYHKTTLTRLLHALLKQQQQQQQQGRAGPQSLALQVQRALAVH